MLKIQTAAVCKAEKNWIFKLFFSEFLGIEYQISYIDSTTKTIINAKESDRQIIIDDSFFHLAEKHWLQSSSMPNAKCQYFSHNEQTLEKNILNKSIPVIYGTSNIKKKPSVTIIDLDIFGSAFFILSRYEEAVAKQYDHHNRFIGSLSFSVKNDLINRPIVNEYIEILWFYLQATWPTLERKKRTYRKIISCDVDYPYSPGAYKISRAIYQGLGDIHKRKSIITAVKSFINPVFTFFKNYNHDPYNTFSWMMDINEQNNNIVTFNFIADHPAGIKDGIYSINEPRIECLLKKINQRQHEIGIHFSYNSYKDRNQLTKEYQILNQTLKKNSISQAISKSRQHYLRWNSETASKLSYVGISHDSTLGFADHAGFRCGICYEYNMYDLHQRKQLPIKQNPLITMEASVISYMNLGYTEKAFELMINLKNTCRHYQGDYALLWHNSHFLTHNDAEFYKELIK